MLIVLYTPSRICRQGRAGQGRAGQGRFLAWEKDIEWQNLDLFNKSSLIGF